MEFLVRTRGENKMGWLHGTKNVLILGLATIGFITGGYESIRGIIALYT
jgi:hypothetical protein